MSRFLLQLAVVLAALAAGARTGGAGLGAWGGVGLVVLVVAFGVTPTDPPVDVLLIIMAVITAATAMEAAGGIDFLVRVAERIIRRYPRSVTLVAPLVAYAFTLCAGTGHILYPLLPVIYQVAYESGIRPERPLAVATIASQQAITASPVSAATAAMIGLFAGQRLGIGLVGLLAICVPSTLLGVIVAALVQTRVGKELADDPEYQRRLAAGEVEPPGRMREEPRPLSRAAPLSAGAFLLGVALVVVAGTLPSLRTLPGSDRPLHMPTVIELIMLAAAAVIFLIARPTGGAVMRTRTAEAGMTAMVGIFGLAWLGDSFIAANREVFLGSLSSMAQAHPPLFGLGLFLASVLLYSQAATARALMPLGVGLGLSGPTLAALFPAVNGYFLIPTYGTVLAAINFDRAGTTGIGKYVLNHSFQLPGLVATGVAVGVGLLIANLFF